MRLLPTWIAFVFCGLTATALTVRVARTELAEPPPFGQAELQAWLTAAKPDESIAVQRRAARQLDRDFHTPVDWQPFFDDLSAAEQKNFAVNWQSLLMLLVEQRADAYRALPSHRRERFLDGQLLDLMTWYTVGPQGKSTGLALFTQILGSASSSQRFNLGTPKIAEFLSALQGRLVQRSLNRVFPGSESERPRED